MTQTKGRRSNGLRMDTAVIDHLIGLLKGRRWL